jgi:TonB family protein
MAKGERGMLALIVATSIFANPAYYPEGARRRGEEGVTRLQLDVSPTGVPEMCRIVQSSGSAELDASACELIQAKMRYAPGVDVRGRPAPSVHSQSVRWQLKSDPEEQRQRQPGLVVLTCLALSLLLYLPMSAIHAFQAGDFWRFEKTGRLALLRAAGRDENPAVYWVALTSRVIALLLVSMAMAELITPMSPANVRLSAPAAQAS